jgi:hypothetical protein
MVRRKGRKGPSHPRPIPSEGSHWLLALLQNNGKRPSHPRPIPGEGSHRLLALLRNNMIEVSIQEATHVRVGTQVERITSKWGIDPRGRRAKVSKGGFGVITESGRRVQSWQADSYLKQVIRVLLGAGFSSI